MFTDAPMPSLNAIRSFVAVAHHLSFTKAAQELHVTVGAVTRQVRILEADLGIPLFQRSGKTPVLTPAGALYYAQVSDLFECINAATRAIRGLQNNNLLSIACLPTFSMRWLIPRLSGFQSEHQDILLDIITRDFTKEELNFSNNLFHVAISYGNGPWSEMEATLLMEEEVGVYCSPNFLQCNADIREPKDLASRPLLVHSSRPHSWDDYFQSFGVTSHMNTPTAVYEHFFMTIEAASSHMGFALLPTIFTEKEIAHGRLVRVLPEETFRTGKSYYLIHPKESGSSRKIRLFKKWLLDEAAEA